MIISLVEYHNKTRQHDWKETRGQRDEDISVEGVILRSNRL